jgi:hypothetical protein
MGLSQIAFEARKIFPFWMAPPAARDGTTSNLLCEIWNRAPCGLEDDSVPFNKCERFFLVHLRTPPLLPSQNLFRQLAANWPSPHEGRGWPPEP